MSPGLSPSGYKKESNLMSLLNNQRVAIGLAAKNVDTADRTRLWAMPLASDTHEEADLAAEAALALKDQSTRYTTLGSWKEALRRLREWSTDEDVDVRPYVSIVTPKSSSRHSSSHEVTYDLGPESVSSAVLGAGKSLSEMDSSWDLLVCNSTIKRVNVPMATTLGRLLGGPSGRPCALDQLDVAPFGASQLGALMEKRHGKFAVESWKLARIFVPQNYRGQDKPPELTWEPDVEAVFTRDISSWDLIHNVGKHVKGSFCDMYAALNSGVWGGDFKGSTFALLPYYSPSARDQFAEMLNRAGSAAAMKRAPKKYKKLQDIVSGLCFVNNPTGGCYDKIVSQRGNLTELMANTNELTTKAIEDHQEYLRKGKRYFLAPTGSVNALYGRTVSVEVIDLGFVSDDLDLVVAAILDALLPDSQASFVETAILMQTPPSLLGLEKKVCGDMLVGDSYTYLPPKKEDTGFYQLPLPMVIDAYGRDKFIKDWKANIKRLANLFSQRLCETLLDNNVAMERHQHADLILLNTRRRAKWFADLLTEIHSHLKNIQYE
jgi:hypothetical protein